MSQPKTTLQKPKPLSAADRNLSMCTNLPRRTPSRSVTANLTLIASDFRICLSTSSGLFMGNGMARPLRAPGSLEGHDNGTKLLQQYALSEGPQGGSPPCRSLHYEV